MNHRTNRLRGRRDDPEPQGRPQASLPTASETSRRRRRLVLALAIGAAATTMACGAVSSDNPADAWRRAADGVADGVSTSRDAMYAVETVDTTARYNPARCDCPAWEVHLDGRWRRVALRADGPLAEPLQGRRTGGSEIPPPFPIRVRLPPDRVSSSTGWRYPALEVLALP